MRTFIHSLAQGVASTALALLLGACSALVDADAADPRASIRAGFLFIGPTSVPGWSRTHEEARQYLETHLDGFESTAVPNISTTEAYGYIENLISDGHNVIVGTSHSFTEPLLEAALNHPEVDFLSCASFRTGPNLGSYFVRMYQAMYLAGFLAGRASNNGRVGVVGSAVLAETVRHLNAFTLGVRAGDPEAVVFVKWVGRWYDPEVEERLTKELIDTAGIDIVMSLTDTVIPIETATDPDKNTDSGPIYAIGNHNADNCEADMSPNQDHCLASMYWTWGPLLEREMLAIQKGTWRPQGRPIWDSIQRTREESPVALTPLKLTRSRVDSRLAVELEELTAEMAKDTVAARTLPFRAVSEPIRDTHGGPRIYPGQPPSDEELLSMCWLVEGIYGLDGEPAVLPPGCEGVL